MGTKKETMVEAARGKGCLGKAADDEPVFILRAQDITAPATIDIWADIVEHRLGAPSPKTIEARQVATAMRVWQAKAVARVKVPD